MVTLEGAAWTSAALWSQVMLEEGQLSTVQVKEAGTGEVTSWSGEMAVTLGGTTYMGQEIYSDVEKC